MKGLLHWLSRRRFPYEPLISISVSRSRILGNIAAFRPLAPGGAIAPVLKSNAYGHGLLEVAGILAKERDIPFFVVDSYFEAVVLRAGHIHKPLLVIGYTRPETMLVSRIPCAAFTVTSLEGLKGLSGACRPIHIHLKIDTGMRRQGILPEEIPEAIKLIKEHEVIILEGICTHLCDADNVDESFTEHQSSVWKHAVRELKSAFPGLRYIHAAATDGARYSADLDSNVLRLGIGLYGLSENAKLAEQVRLLPALEMKTVVTGVKKLKAGETAGYGNSFMAKKDMAIATIPVGYYEGLDRRLSNKGTVQVGSGRIACPIIGRVSMNIAIIDVTGAAGAKIGDEVVVVNREASDSNSLVSMARAANTISYDLAVHIPAHLKRIVVE